MITVAQGRADLETFFFGCEGEALLGILHRPAMDAPAFTATTGVVVIVGGPQYRAGSHRQFVHLAGALAAAGHPVLRFDVRGMGDSTGSPRSFEQITPDISAAIDALRQYVPGVQRVMLWGLCDAASAALLYLHERADPRVQGLCLANPWIRSPATLARTHVKHYYTQRLRERSFWIKLLRGAVALRAFKELVASVRGARRTPDDPSGGDFQSRMLRGWQRHQGPTLLLLSGSDYTAKEFVEHAATHPKWQTVIAAQTICRYDLKGLDHTFSNASARAAVAALTVNWLADTARPALIESHQQQRTP